MQKGANSNSQSQSEIWRSVPGFEGIYAVSDQGRVKSYKVWHGTNERVLKPAENQGYLRVSLSRNGKQSHRYIHRLVADAFLGACPDRYEVNHKNGEKGDNWLENLEYCTRSENMCHAHSELDIDTVRGERNGKSKLTKAKVLEIRRSYAMGSITLRELSADFCVSISQISLIVNRKTWTHID